MDCPRMCSIHEMRSYKHCDLPTFSKEIPIDARWKQLLKLEDECGNILLPNLRGLRYSFCIAKYQDTGQKYSSKLILGMTVD